MKHNKTFDLNSTIEKQQLQITLLEEELKEANLALMHEQNQCAALQSDIEHLIELIRQSKDKEPNPQTFKYNTQTPH